MNKQNSAAQTFNCWPRPLCCRYLVVLFERLPVQVLDQNGIARDDALFWAFGVLAIDEYEVLGAWPKPLSRGSGWQQVFDDLKVRGVAKIQFALSSESAAFRSALSAAYPGATALPPPWHPETLSALPARYRSAVRASAVAVQLLQRRATRAIARHGRFPDLADANAFVMDALKRAEHSIEVSGAGEDANSNGLLAAGTRSKVSRTAALGH